MVSAELFEQLNGCICQAVSAVGTYKLRPDKTPRPFGCINLLTVADFWQLPPVGETALFERQSRAPSSTAADGLELIWGRSRRSLRRVWELTEPMRCGDPWLLALLNECRDGRLSAQNYMYIHGAPTDQVGSMILGEAAPRCCNAECNALQDGQWQSALMRCLTAASLMNMECAVCQAERAGRCRVVVDVADPRFGQAPFDQAPYIHPHNVPKYAAFHLRAQLFARRNGRCVNWVCAHDKPLHPDDLALAPQALEEKRKRWLRLHDQNTERIMGLLPMIRGLPVRLTQTVNKALGVVKHRSGAIVEWTLHADESSAEAGGERCLRYQPLYIYVRFEGESWQIGDLDPGVYPLQPYSKIWVVNKESKIKAKRTGFCCVPDFSGTCHMYQGASLQAVIVDCLLHNSATATKDMLACYVTHTLFSVETCFIVPSFCSKNWGTPGRTNTFSHCRMGHT